MRDKSITPYNNKNQRHGYWERYWDDGDLWYKGFYNNGKRVGYSEWHNYNNNYNNNNLTIKTYNI